MGGAKCFKCDPFEHLFPLFWFPFAHFYAVAGAHWGPLGGGVGGFEGGTAVGVEATGDIGPADVV